MFGAGDPADVVVGVEGDAAVAFGGGEDAEAVVVDKDGGGAALAGVGLHGFFERFDRRRPTNQSYI